MRGCALLIRIDRVKDEGLVLDAEEAVETFPGLKEVAVQEGCEFSAPVETHLRVVLVSGMVEVEGRVSTRLRMACSRCLGEFERPLKADFSLTYVRELPEVEDESDEEGVELSAEEMGLIQFHGEEIDLRGAVEEQVIMAIPVRPLCGKACKGLCAECGADLNAGDCGCRRVEFNVKFAALKDFKAKQD